MAETISKTVKKVVAKSSAESAKSAAKKPAAKPAKPAAEKTVAKPVKPVAATGKAAKPVAAPAKSAGKGMTVSDEQRYRMVAEAAYYRAESNHFKSDPLRDWIDAESDIAALLSGK